MQKVIYLNTDFRSSFFPYSDKASLKRRESNGMICVLQCEYIWQLIGQRRRLTFRDLALANYHILISSINHNINFFKPEFYGRLHVDPCLRLKSAVTVFRYLRMKHFLCA